MQLYLLLPVTWHNLLLGAERPVPFLAQEYNSTLFSIPGCVQTVAIIGPIFGFLLGSLCAKLYVDIGFVDLGKSEHSGFKNPVRLQNAYFRSRTLWLSSRHERLAGVE